MEGKPWLMLVARRLHRFADTIERYAYPKWTLGRDGLQLRGLRLGGPPSTRWRDVLLADPCPYCGERSTTIDHIYPRSRGGKDGSQNETGACESCNTAKRSALLLYFLIARRPTPAPYRPPGPPPRRRPPVGRLKASIRDQLRSKGVLT